MEVDDEEDVQVFNPKIYGDVHISFLQHILVNGILTSSEASLQFTNALRNCRYSVPSGKERLQFISDMMGSINKEIASMFLRIKQTFCEYTGLQLIVLVEVIVRDGKGEATIRECLNEVYELDSKVSIKSAESFINRLVKERWFLEENGTLRLSTKAIVDLESYLIEEFDAKRCLQCKDLVIVDKDQVCDHCESKIHKFCMARYVKRSKRPAACINESCKSPWSHVVPDLPNSHDRSQRSVRNDNPD